MFKYKKGDTVTYKGDYYPKGQYIIRQLGHAPEQPAYFIFKEKGKWPDDGGHVFERELK